LQFVENETNGSPISREFRSLIYQRAKESRDTRTFDTIFDVNRAGYEWVNHSLQTKHLSDIAPRVKFGGEPPQFLLCQIICRPIPEAQN